MKVLFKILVITVLFANCKNEEAIINSPLDRLSDNKAGDIVKKAIDFAGGWDAWQSKQNFSFYKKITHVDSSGAVVRSVRQWHRYNLGDQFQACMTWDLDGSQYEIINNGEQAKKYKDGIELTDDKSKNEAWNSSFGSHYVIAMPYKLTDPGTTLTYEGIDEVTLDQPVHSVKVAYAKGAGSTGGMHDWWYYFAIDNFDLVGNYLDYGEGYSLTTYEVFEDVEEMRIHNKRYSYLSNEDKERVQLKTIYENEEMKFNQEFASTLFELK